MAFITTNYYPTATQAQILRTDFKRRSCIVRLINFNEVKIFDSALGQHNMITVLTKKKDDRAICQSCITNRSGWASTTVLRDIMNGSDAQSNYCQIAQSNLYEGVSAYIRLAGSSESSTDPVQMILKKLQGRTTPLGSMCNVNQGILTVVAFGLARFALRGVTHSSLMPTSRTASARSFPAAIIAAVAGAMRSPAAC